MFDYLIGHPQYMRHVQTIADYIDQRIKRANYPEIEKVQFALDFVQAPNIVYRIDENTV